MIQYKQLKVRIKQKQHPTNRSERIRNMNEAEQRVSRALRKLDVSGNRAMTGMAFIDDLAMVGGTDESYGNPDTFDEAWEHPNITERKNWRDAIRKEFNNMIKRKVWRETCVPYFRYGWLIIK